jgi:hypothetical protein
MSLLQSLMDQKRFFQFNTHGYELGQHIKEKGIDTPFRIDFLRGRKTNPQPFNSWLGHDALEAWKRYFEQVRGYPKEGEMAALVWNHKQKQLHPIAMRLGHLYNLRKLGYIKGKGKLTSRYGLGMHELRDLARSLLEKAKEVNFNTLSAEYWMGHTVDRMFYNKVWTLDPEYNLAQYRIAEKYLNVLSGSAGVSEAQTRIKELEDRLAKLEAVYTKTIEVKAE